MKYFSMFAGIGGFEAAFPSSWECVGYSEINPYATTIYCRHYPNHKGYGDATGIDTTTLPDFDLLTGGFPCQPFSVAGKRKGFADARGTLFFEVARLLSDKRPRYFLLENVKGLLSIGDGQVFTQIKYLGFSPTLATTVNGKCLIVSTSVFPKIESESSLSDILEPNPDLMYFLSTEQVQKMIVYNQKVANKGLQHSVSVTDMDNDGQTKPISSLAQEDTSQVE